MRKKGILVRKIKKIIETEKDPAITFFQLTSYKKRRKISFTKIPLFWKKIYFKIYPRCSQIKIEKKSLFSKSPSIFYLLLKRSSQRKFNKTPLSFKEISQVLYFSAGIKKNKKSDQVKRMYPSAGARYPLEIYVVILNSKEIPEGIYHYNVKWNTLELLEKGDFKQIITEATQQKWVRNSAMVIIITAIFERTVIKYGIRGWRYILLDAGHLAQNVYLVSTALRLKCCSIGGFVDEKIIKLLDLNPNFELPIYLIAIGK